MSDLKSLFTDLADHTEEMEAEDIAANKKYGILSYIGILVLIPIFKAKDSAFAKFHANQGLALLIAEVACSVLSNINYIGWIFTLISIGCTVEAVFGIVNAAKGKAKELPILNKIKLLK